MKTDDKKKYSESHKIWTIMKMWNVMMGDAVTQNGTGASWQVPA